MGGYSPTTSQSNSTFSWSISAGFPSGIGLQTGISYNLLDVSVITNYNATDKRCIWVFSCSSNGNSAQYGNTFYGKLIVSNYSEDVITKSKFSVELKKTFLGIDIDTEEIGRSSYVILSCPDRT